MPRFPDLRNQLGSASTFFEQKKICANLKENLLLEIPAEELNKYQGVDWNLNEKNIKITPYWLAQPYIRAEKPYGNDSEEDLQIVVCKSALKKAQKLELQKLKKERRQIRLTSLTTCINCRTNVASVSCTIKMCKTCCKTQNENCLSHNSKKIKITF